MSQNGRPLESFFATTLPGVDRLSQVFDCRTFGGKLKPKSREVSKNLHALKAGVLATGGHFEHRM